MCEEVRRKGLGWGRTQIPDVDTSVRRNSTDKEQSGGTITTGDLWTLTQTINGTEGSWSHHGSCIIRDLYKRLIYLLSLTYLFYYS